MAKTLSGLQTLDLDHATVYHLDVDNILNENLSCINASFISVSCINSSFCNLNFNTTSNHINSVTFAYISNLTSDTQQQFNFMI